MITKERRIKKIYISIIFLVTGIVSISSALLIPVFAQDVITHYPPAGAAFECEGFESASEYNGVKYHCSCSPSKIVCTPGSSGTAPSIPSGKGNDSSQQMQLMMMQGILQPLFNSMFSSMFSPEPQGPSPEEVQRQKDEELNKQAEERFDLLNKWHSLRQQDVKNKQDKDKNLVSLLAVDSGATPESNGIKPSSGTPFFSHDINSVLGNVAMDQTMDKIEGLGSTIVNNLDEKYKKEWGSKIYEKGLPILKIAVTAQTEGKEAAGVETIDYAVSLIPMPSLQQGVAEVGRKIYAKVAFGSLDKFLEETENAGTALGFDFNKDEFKQSFENDMNTGQRII